MSSQLALIEDYTNDPIIGFRTPPIRCLLVDDNRFDRYNVRYASERAGLQLHFFEAATASEARQMIHTESFGLIILDQNLPDGEGLELAAEASLSPLNNATPRIMLTSMDDSRLARGASEVGCVEFLVKSSLNGNTFSNALRRALDKSMATISAQDFPAASDAFEMMLEGFGEVFIAQTIKPAIARIRFLTDRMRSLPSDSTEHATALAEIANLCDRITSHLGNEEEMDQSDSFSFHPG